MTLILLTLNKTDLVCKSCFYLKKMQGITPISRAELRDLPEKRRRDAIIHAVDQVVYQVRAAATEGKGFCIVNIGDIVRERSGFKVHSHPPPYTLTVSDMVEGLQAKFPDCKVEYTEMWEDTQPGVRQQKKGVLVDWS